MAIIFQVQEKNEIADQNSGKHDGNCFWQFLVRFSRAYDYFPLRPIFLHLMKVMCFAVSLVAHAWSDS